MCQPWEISNRMQCVSCSFCTIHASHNIRIILFWLRQVSSNNVNGVWFELTTSRSGGERSIFTLPVGDTFYILYQPCFHIICTIFWLEQVSSNNVNEVGFELTTSRSGDERSIFTLPVGDTFYILYHAYFTYPHDFFGWDKYLRTLMIKRKVCT